MIRENEELIRRISHEIRTPLNAIIGLSYLSKESEAVPDKVYENLDKIEQSAHYLLSFINDILSLYDLEGGKIALENDTVEIETFLGRLLDVMQQIAEEKQICFKSEILGGLEGHYVLDKKRLSEVLRQLFLNAVKATPAGGTISVQAELLSETEECAKVLFTIADNGVGIEADQIEKAFEPFEQIYGENRTLYSGSGLELAITKTIVELMKGEIHVNSKKGEGTAIQLVLSLRKERRSQKRVKEQKEAKGASYDFSGMRALIVEDSNINIEIAKNILVHKNFEVEVALNGEEAVTAFKEHEAGYYDVILMDIRMPVMDGLEATKQIRHMEGREDGCNIPIIAMTANAFEEDVKKSLEAGMNRHLSKPIDIKKMYGMLDEILNEA